jgi:hypothetical protein
VPVAIGTHSFRPLDCQRFPPTALLAQATDAVSCEAGQKSEILTNILNLPVAEFRSKEGTEPRTHAALDRSPHAHEEACDGTSRESRCAAGTAAPRG